MSGRAIDFTEGPIAKNMLRFAGPLFLSNVLQTSDQFVDSLWVGNLLGADALAALSISAPITFAVLSFMIGINATTLTVLSQHRGQGDHEGSRKSLNAFVVILGIVFLLGYNFISTVFRALGDSKTPLYIVLAAVLLNIALDPLFIAGFGWGMAGAAYATVAAQDSAVFLNARPLINMFVSDAPTIAFGSSYLKVTAYFYVFLGVKFVLNGIVRSSGAMLQVLALNIVSFWVLRFPLVYVFSRFYGAIGIAYGYSASLVVSSVNFVPTSAAMEPFLEELAAYKQGKGSFQIPYDKPIPEELVRKIALFRLKDVRENDARWM